MLDLSIACAGQYSLSPSQYFMLPVPACWRYGHDALNRSWVNVCPPSVTMAHIQCGAKHDKVTQYRANVGPAFGRRLVFYLLHDKKCWQKWMGQNAQTERTEEKQHVPNFLQEGKHNKLNRLLAYGRV